MFLHRAPSKMLRKGKSALRKFTIKISKLRRVVTSNRNIRAIFLYESKFGKDCMKRKLQKEYEVVKK